MIQSKKIISPTDRKRIEKTIKWAEELKIINSTRKWEKIFKETLNSLKRSIE